jgi:hypothetical protein
LDGEEGQEQAQQEHMHREARGIVRPLQGYPQ